MLETSRTVRATASTREHYTRALNFGLLVAGMGGGQGAVFAVQSWLLAHGQFELLSLFATHYSIAILGVLVVDGGTSSLLARDAARCSEMPERRDDLWRVFSETGVFRSFVGLAVAVGVIGFATTFASNGFSRWYLLLAIPGWMVWAWNAAGLLDGFGRSGVGGVLGAIPYAASAGALVVVPQDSPAAAGAVLGGAFSLGYCLTVGAQWAALAIAGDPVRFRRPTRAGLTRSLRDGTALLCQLVPNQANPRVALVLSTLYLGTETAALFAYIKQIIIALGTLAAFVVRIEFPSLVQKLSRSKRSSVRGIFEAQTMTLYFVAALTLGAIMVSGVAIIGPQSNFSKAAELLLLFAPTIPTALLSMMLVQGLIALGAYAPAARIVMVGAVAGMIASYLLIDSLGVYALLFGELLFHMIAFGLTYFELRHFKR